MGLLSHAHVGIRPTVWVASGDDPFERQIALSQRAEKLGFDGVFFGDRMLASATAHDGGIYNSTHTDALVTYAAVAARTTKIKIGSLVLVVPFRNPIQLAKSLASIDLLSSGRFIFGAGAGWNEAEFECLGLNKKEAGSRFEEGVEIIQQLWAQESVTYHGRHFGFENVSIEPKPVQAGGPPVWLGSFSPAGGAIWKDGRLGTGTKSNLARVGRLGDGWVPVLYSNRWKRSIDPFLLGEAWDIVREHANERRTPRQIGFEFSHWYYIIENAEDEEEAMRALAAFFPGNLDEARRTYLVGSPDDIVQKIMFLTSEIDTTDWFLFSMLGPSERQMDLLASKVLPLLDTCRSQVKPA